MADNDKIIIFFGFLAFLGFIAYLMWTQQANQKLISPEEVKKAREAWRR